MSATPTLSLLLTAGVAVAVVYLSVVAGLAVAAALRAGGRREDAPSGHEAVSVSRFTIPVSIIVPVPGEHQGLTTALTALLNLHYPEFEVIVVADGPASGTIDSLVHDWDLEAKEFFYRRWLETAEVHRIYRSARDSRLMVIDKAAGGYSDAMNCGVNVARYRYVMSVSPDVALDEDALLRAMAAPMRNPAQVVGASSHLEPGAWQAQEGRVSARHASSRLARLGTTFERLASVRSLMESRLAWRHLRAGFGQSDAVLVWRRDAVLKSHGFSPVAADPDLDLMFRLQAATTDGSARFDVGSDIVGRTRVRPVASMLRTAARRQVAALQVLWDCLLGRGAAIERRALAYFIEAELVTPLAQQGIVAGTVVGAVFGWFTWSTFVLAVVGLSFGHAAVTAAALLLRGAAPKAPGLELRHLLIAAPFEFVCYRAAFAPARLATMVMCMARGRGTDLPGRVRSSD